MRQCQINYFLGYSCFEMFSFIVSSLQPSSIVSYTQELTSFLKHPILNAYCGATNSFIHPTIIN